MNEYSELKRRLVRGWNTWNTRSVLSHVLLPEGFAVNLCLKEHGTGTTWRDHYLKDALIGRYGEYEEEIHPGAHAYDGSYTSLNLKWRGIELTVESAATDDDLVLLVTPEKNQKYPATLVIESGILWNREGIVRRAGDMLTATAGTREINVYTTQNAIEEFNIPTQAPYLVLELREPIGISTGMRRTLEEIRKIIDANKARHDQCKKRYGELSEVYNAMQSCVAWDTIYEPSKDRVVTPVSRLWNIKWGGYVLFCWDTYFAAWLAMIDNKDLAYANAIEITKEMTERGFVPNFAADPDCKSRDRSQPPVGSMTIWELYKRYHEKWLLEEVFENLYSWNQWWNDNRTPENGLLAWGSNPFGPKFGCGTEYDGVGNTLGAAYESGLDNSPMYDGVPFNHEKSYMELADVGLTGMYVKDCLALADIAEALDKKAEMAELKNRAELFSCGLMRLWDEKSGIFLNKHTDSGEPSL
jgi:putative isomerase